MLASRVFRRVRFSALSRRDVIGAMPAYHPLYRHADPELLGLIDDLFSHGQSARLGGVYPQRAAAR